MAHDMNNLIVLKYAPNECWTQVVDALGFEQRDFDIFLDKGEWALRGKDYQIGKSRYINLSGSDEVIGVYDRTDTEQLDRMSYDAIVATKPKASPLDYQF